MPSGPWELGWDAIASLATAAATLLAVVAILFSARAAKASARAADASVRAAEAAEEQLAAQTMPVIVERPRGDILAAAESVTFPDGHEVTSSRAGEIMFSAHEAGSDPVRVSIPVQNVGPGLAEIVDAYVSLPNNRRIGLRPVAVEVRLFTVEASLRSQLYLPPGGHQRLTASVSRDHPDWNAIVKAARSPIGKGLFKLGGLGVLVVIQFTDVSGERYFETRLAVRRSSPEDAWTAARVDTRRIDKPPQPAAEVRSTFTLLPFLKGQEDG